MDKTLVQNTAIVTVVALAVWLLYGYFVDGYGSLSEVLVTAIAFALAFGLSFGYFQSRRMKRSRK